MNQAYKTEIHQKTIRPIKRGLYSTQLEYPNLTKCFKRTNRN